MRKNTYLSDSTLSTIQTTNRKNYLEDIKTKNQFQKEGYKEHINMKKYAGNGGSDYQSYLIEKPNKKKGGSSDGSNEGEEI